MNKKMSEEHYEVLVFDTSQKDVGTTLSEPEWTINTRTFTRGAKIRFSVAIPPIPQIFSTNKTITIDAVDYTIDEGFYENDNDLIDAVNTAILASGVTMALSTRTALVTATAGGNFTMTSTIGPLGFSATEKSGAATYTSENVCQINENALMICSNLETLTYHHSTSTKREAFLPGTLLLATTYPVVSAYHHVQSEWIRVENTETFSVVSFFFATPSTPSSAVELRHPWSVVLEFQR